MPKPVIGIQGASSMSELSVFMFEGSGMSLAYDEALGMIPFGNESPQDMIFSAKPRS
jgi:hypothetical protein